VTKLFDGCISRISDRQFTVNLGNIQGQPPYTFVSVVSSGATTVSNLVITPPTPPNAGNERSRVEFDATVPISVTYTDGAGVTHHVSSSVKFHREVFLHIPDASIVPATVSVSTSLVSVAGSFTAFDEVTFRCCIMQITKVVAVVDLLVPSYGFCEFPSCDEAGPCEAFFNLPLFPPFA